MADLHQKAINTITSRLAYTDSWNYNHANSFSGTIKCTFDPRMPLNITDLTQPFVLVCASPPGFFYYVIWGILYVGGGLVALVALYLGGVAAYDCLKERWQRTQENTEETTRLA